jgi:hypothetical protein
MGFLDDAIGSIGQDLAKTAVENINQATGINAGTALSYLFGNGQEKGGDNMALLGPAIMDAFGQQQQILTQLQAELYQQGVAIQRIGQQLVGISNALTQITGMIENLQQLLNKIGQEQLYEEWQAVDDQLTKYIAAINSAFAAYGSYMSNYKTTKSVEVGILIENILSVNDGPVVGLRAIHDFIVAGGQARSVLRLWTAMVTPLVQTGMLDYRLAVQQYFEYYQKLAYAQLRAANLVMEAYNFHEDKPNAKRIWDQYNSQLREQEDVFITSLLPLVYAGVEGGIFVPAGQTGLAINFTSFDASLQLNPGLQYVRGNDNQGDAFYTPSQIFYDAEKLLANLYVTAPTQRRIVVHMLYPDGRGINTLLDGLSLTISSNGSSGAVNPASSNRLGGPFPFPGPNDWSPDFPDQNIYSGNGFYLKRYVYTEGPNGLIDGEYFMMNLNGRNGLVPLQTYVTSDRNLPPAPFQQDCVVEYPMQVNAANQFDFMNFSAYTVPFPYYSS